MSFPSDNFTFGGAAYRLVIPAMNQRAPRPRAGNPGQWTHIPYGGNIFESDSGRLHTVWTPPGGIVIVNDAAYATFDAVAGTDTFVTLTTPWGTFTARLASLDAVPMSDGSYMGPASWEWE